jgi:hypothetical protein
MIRQTHRNVDGAIRNASSYTHDAGGRVAEWALYKPDGTAAQRIAYTYDGRGRETGESVYRADGTLASGQTRIYDERGNVTEKLRHVNGVPVSRERFAYEFDGRGNWVKMRVSREALKDGNPQPEVVEVIYRTITYH